MSVSADELIGLLSTRRVCRDFAPDPVPERDLVALLEAARWASSAGNRRVHRFLVLQDPEQIRLAKALAPGVLARPPAIIAICVDRQAAERAGVRLGHETSTFVDVGTSAMAMMTVAHALGLGTCPATSFSHGGVRTVLDLPAQAEPEMLLLVGRPRTPEAAAPRVPARPSRKLAELAYWQRYGAPLPPRLLG